MKKIIIGIIIGVIISGTIGVLASTIISSNNVTYQNKTVKESLDELYSKATKYREYQNGDVVYYNPVTNKRCSAKESNSQTGTKTGCMKWYTFNDEGSNSSTVNMILDHNTTATIPWNTNNKNVTYEDSDVKPEIEKLVSESKWSVTPRLISAEEVAKITGNVNWISTRSWYCLESNKQDETSLPYCNNKGTYGWLYDHMYCKQYSYDWKCYNNDTSTYGYWTSTTYGIAGSGSDVWRVSRDGNLNNSNSNTSGDGVRPVITISKNVIS